jgi:dolichol kinase
MNAVYAVLVLGAVPAAAEVLKRRRVGSSELLRKTVHIGDGLLASALPLFVSFRAIAGIALFFAGAMAISRRRRIFTAVHDVERRSYGEIFYPLGIALLATFFPHWRPFVYGVLVIALADGLAAPVGMRFGRRKLPGGKSVAGSATFFAISLSVGLALALAPVVAIAAAVVLTVAEASLRYGLDNLVLPPLAALLIGVSVTPMLVAQALYLTAPVVIAGVVHGFVIRKRLLPGLVRPLDGGRTFRGRPVFGRNKTWRGLVVMSLVSTLIVLTQRLLSFHDAFRSVSVVDYRAASTFALGLALGLGYSLAELPNSFLKRRLGIEPGRRARRRGALQYVVDQGDSAAGVVLALLLFVSDPSILVCVFVCGLALHAFADSLFYVFGVKQRVLQAAPAVAGTS